MDRLLWVVLEILDLLSLGSLRRWGAPDPEALRDEARRSERGELDRIGRAGSVGVVVTPLRPSGKVTIDGRTYEATSEGDYLDPGSRVEVIGRKGFALIVRARP